MNKKNSIHQFMVFFKAALLLSVSLAFMACPNAVLEPPERETPSYTVSFNANGGSGNMNSITVQEGTIITLNDCPFTKSGMMFVAWNTNGDGHGTGYPNETSLIVTKDMTLYAQWAIPHTVTFKANGGTGSDYTQTVPENIATILKENSFTKSGKVLAYWNTTSSGTGTSYADQGSAIFTQDTVLYAVWKNPCTVTFTSNGGSAVENQIVAEGNKAKEPAAPKKDGYRFMGWYSDSALTSQFSFDTAITANTTLYASWKKVFTITFNANGGSGEIAPQTLLEGDEITLRGNTFTRTDYGFACWNTSSDGSGDRYDDRETITPTDSMTLYAQWGMNCTVSFNKNNDDAEGSMEEISAPAGSSVSLPASLFTRTGYYVSGWNTSADGSGTAYANGQTIVLNESQILYAQWREGSGSFYPVNIPSVEHGTVTSNVESAMAGSIITLTVTPDEDYKLGSITITSGGQVVPYTETEANTTYQFAMPDGDIAISIEFALRGYAVVADENLENGSFTTDADYYQANEEVTLRVIPDDTYSYVSDSIIVKDINGDEIALTEESDADGTFYTFTMPEGNVTLYAEFEKLLCKLTFASSITGCDDMPAEMNVGMGSDTVLPSCTYFYSDNGYTFKNWNTKADGSGESYEAGESFRTNDDVTLYAQCDPGYITTAAYFSTLLSKIKSHNLSKATIIITDAANSDLTGTGTSTTQVSSIAKSLNANSTVRVDLTLKANANLTAIGNYAFCGNSNLTSIIYPDNIASIGDYAFHSTSLTSVTIPNSVTSIGNSAFRNNTSIQTITIPENVASMGSYAFYGCSRLSTVSFASGCKLKKIDDYAFYGCSSLKTFSTSGMLIETLGNYALSSCSSLTSLTIGWRVKTLGNNLCTDCSKLNSVTFEGGSSCISIGNNAFSGLTKITSIDLPYSVQTIGDSAFEGTKLTSIYLPGSLTQIGSRAFYGLTTLQGEVVIPGDVSWIGSYAFSGCKYIWFKFAPSSNTSTMTINEYAFSNTMFKYNSTGMEIYHDITLPARVSEIKANAFSGCTHIKSINFEANSKLKTLGTCVFAGCSKLEEVNLPPSVTSIAEGAFDKMSYIRLLTIPFIGGAPNTTSAQANTLFGYIFGKTKDTYDNEASQSYGGTNPVKYYIPNSLGSVTVLGGRILYGAFHNCKVGSIIINSTSSTIIPEIAFFNTEASIDIPSNVTEIQRSAFANAKPGTIPASVKTIGSRAFSGATFREEPVFASGSKLETIGEYAFEKTKYNSAVSTVVLPSSVKTIGTFLFLESSIRKVSFANCTSLTTIPTSTFSKCQNLTSVTLHSGISSIESYAFDNCKSLTGITLSSNLLTIGNDAFQNCSNLASITIPSKVTSIGNYAFENCSKLASVSMPASLTTLGRYAFQNCTSLYSMSFASSPKLKTIQDSTFYGCTAISDTTGFIPGSVTTIESNAFKNCTGITKLYIPNSLTSIAQGSFNGCSGITEADLPYTGKTPSSTGKEGCFGWLFGTGNYTGSYYVGQTFDESNNTLEARIPSSLTKVTVRGTNAPYGAFSKCTSIKTIIYSVSYVSGMYFGDYLCWGCTGLTSFTFPDGSNNTVGEDAFRECTALTTITIPDGYVKIGGYAFAGCTSLTTVTIGKDVTQIGPNCLYGNSALAYVYFYPAKKNWYYTSNSDYTGGTKSTTLSGEKYKQDWENFAKCFRSDKDWAKYLYWKAP